MEQEAWLEVVLAMAVLAVALAAGVLLLARPKLQHRCRPWCLRETWDEVEAVLVEVQVAVAAVAAAVVVLVGVEGPALLRRPFRSTSTSRCGQTRCLPRLGGTARLSRLRRGRR